MKPEAKQYTRKALKAFNETGLPKKFTAQAGSNGYEITIYDVIGSETCNAATFADALKQANGAPVTIRMSSPGGSVFDGWTMYNNLADYEGDTTIIVDGVAASIASIISLGADKVLTQPTSLWMVHNSSVLAYGDHAELSSNAQALEKIDQNLAEIYAKKSGTPAADWADMMNKETWFTAKEAVDIGLADAFAETQPAKTSKTKAQASAAIEKAPINETSKFIAQAVLADAVVTGDSNETSPAGLIQAALVMLQDAITLTTKPEANTKEATEIDLAKALRIRRALIASKL